MPCEACDWAYEGAGLSRIAPYPDMNNNRPMGNSDLLNYGFETDEKVMTDKTDPNGGICATTDTITDIPFNMQLREFCPNNLGLAQRGTVTTVTGGTTISAEPHTAYKGGMIITENIIDINGAIVVTGPSATPTYAVGTDYLISDSGIIPTEGGAIANAADVEITYDTVDSYKIDAVTSVPGDWTIVFPGYNKARSNKPVRVVMHRVQIKAVEQLDWLSDDFGVISLSGRLKKKDSTAPGNFLSSYVTVDAA